MLGRTIALAAALAFAAGTAAQAAEIRVLQSGAFKAAMADIKPLFEQASGHKLVLDCRHLGPDRRAHRQGRSRPISSSRPAPASMT